MIIFVKNIINLLKKYYNFDLYDDKLITKILLCLLFRKVNNIICIKFNIDTIFSFENLINLNKNDLYNIIYKNNNYLINVLKKLNINEKIFKHINKNILYDIFKELDKITDFNNFKYIDINNYVFNNKYSNSNLFTYFISKLNINNNKTFYDGCCGIGISFMKYIDYCINNNIDINADNLYGSDINKDYIKYLSIYIFLYKDFTKLNISCIDSLRKDNNMKYDNIIMDIPNGKYSILTNENLLELENQNYIYNNTLLDNQLLFLHHTLLKLNTDGNSFIFLDYKIIDNNNKLYKTTIKYIIENFNLQNIYIYNSHKKYVIFNIINNNYTNNINIIKLQNDELDFINEINKYTINVQEIITNDFKIIYQFNPFNNISFSNYLETKHLGDLFDILSVKYDIPDYNNIINYKKNYTYEIESYSEYTNKFYLYYNSKENDIIINLNNSNITLLSSKKWYYGLYAILKLKFTYINQFNIHFIYHYLKNNNNLLEFIKTKNFSNLLNINLLKYIPIPLLSLDKQNEIINNFNNNNIIINHLNNNISTLENKNSLLFNDFINYNI